MTTLSLALPAGVLTFFILLSARGFSGIPPAIGDLLRDLGVMALALVAYGAFFALLGVLLKRPVIPGLMFLYGWELMANLPGYLPRFTLTAWLRSLIHHRPAQEGLAGLFQQVLPVRAGPGRPGGRLGGLPGRRRLDLFHPRVRSRAVKGCFP